MKTIFYILVLLTSVCLLGSCLSPTDVDANRNRIVDDGYKELNKHIFTEPQELTFYFKEPVGSETKYFNIINGNSTRYTLDKIYFKHSTRFFSKSHHVLPVTLESRFNQRFNFETVYVTFEPREPGEYYEEIYINDMDIPILKIKGIVQTLQMPGIDFGEVPLGNSKRINVNVTNYSKNSVFIRGATLNDPNDVFSFETFNYPIEVKSRQGFSFWVKFQPTNNRMYTATIVFSIQADGLIDNTCELAGFGR